MSSPTLNRMSSPALNRVSSPTPVAPAERAVLIVLAGGLLVYALLALLGHRFISGLVAPVVAALLAWRHPRARFSAYVFFSALVFRGLVAGLWPLALFGGAGIVALQTPPARRVWPRLAPGRTRASST